MLQGEGFSGGLLGGFFGKKFLLGLAFLGENLVYNGVSLYMWTGIGGKRVLLSIYCLQVVEKRGF